MAEYKAAVQTAARMTETGEYLAINNETPAMIAAKLGVDLKMLVEVNRLFYKGLTSKAKLREGTVMRLRPMEAAEAAELEAAAEAAALQAQVRALATQSTRRRRVACHLPL